MLEIADDSNADYKQLAKHPLELIADDCWNEGAVLGSPVKTGRQSTSIGRVSCAAM